MSDLRTAAQQALEALEAMQSYAAAERKGLRICDEAITALRAALAEDARDWSLLEATQESLREHMAEIQQMRATLAQPAASGERPTAWLYRGIKADGSEHGPHLVWNPAYMDAMSASKGAKATPLYATAQPAPARAPLTDAQLWQSDEIMSLNADLGWPMETIVMFCRAVERAHGIGTPAKEAPPTTQSHPQR